VAPHSVVFWTATQRAPCDVSLTTKICRIDTSNHSRALVRIRGAHKMASIRVAWTGYGAGIVMYAAKALRSLAHASALDLAVIPGTRLAVDVKVCAATGCGDFLLAKFSMSPVAGLAGNVLWLPFSQCDALVHQCEIVVPEGAIRLSALHLAHSTSRGEVELSFVSSEAAF
jgi:hypothetical protein